MRLNFMRSTNRTGSRHPIRITTRIGLKAHCFTLCKRDETLERTPCGRSTVKQRCFSVRLSLTIAGRLQTNEEDSDRYRRHKSSGLIQHNRTQQIPPVVIQCALLPAVTTAPLALDIMAAEQTTIPAFRRRVTGSRANTLALDSLIETVQLVNLTA